ncbi:Signal transduction histidine kinase [Mesobacillus persicus]|uniref:histidine kinase n=1 Tax=Mesobacillus persicus TaxID=930146 RepID=A0A1H8ARW1_9BACI|nr:ATP-binding protein [Mesobacillus persicus]SEM72247.1 Signal transduction histidine kinase [Mesobacillus persicus]
MSKDKNNLHTFQSAEEELNLYKRLIAELPVEIDYFDEKTNLRIRKAKQDLSISMEEVRENGHAPIHLTYPSLKNSFEELEAFLQPMLDLVPHHIVFINKDGIITLCNKQTVNDLNGSQVNVIGQHISTLLRMDDSQIKLLETLRTREEIHDLEVLDSNYGIINTRIIYDENGEILRVVGLFHFLNHLKEAEKMNMIGQISASIAHEVRNPLTTVRGYLQLVGQGQMEANPHLFQTLLIPELDRANKIISDFLMVSKSSPMLKEPKLVIDFINHFKGLLYSEAILKKIDLHVSMSEELADTLILINQSELIQVFINLFNNAVESKGIHDLEIRLLCTREKNTILFQFKDNGKGIENEHLKYIFDPFFSTKDTGTGLGLSLTKKIIELHGGTLSVSSTPHKGTIFTIKIPIYGVENEV